MVFQRTFLEFRVHYALNNFKEVHTPHVDVAFHSNYSQREWERSIGYVVFVLLILGVGSLMCQHYYTVVYRRKLNMEVDL